MGTLLTVVGIAPVGAPDFVFENRAPAVAGPGTGRLVLDATATLVNPGSDVLQVSVGVSVPGSSTASALVPGSSVPILAQQTRVVPLALVYPFVVPPLIPAGGLSLLFTIHASGLTSSADFLHSSPLLPLESPIAGGSYRAWGEVRDLRPGEFWSVPGTPHALSGSQVFGHDVILAVATPFGTSELLPGTRGQRNEDFRAWGKPVYAMADGIVEAFRNDFEDNAVPGRVALRIRGFFTPRPDGVGQDGNGNFVAITDRNRVEVVLYAHLQKGSVSAAIVTNGPGHVVRAGDFLGVVGNSGNSDAPHLHIHASEPGSVPVWTGPGRMMPFRRGRILSWAEVPLATAASWVPLAERLFPLNGATGVALWPSDRTVMNLQDVSVKDAAVSASDRVWVIRADHQIRRVGPLPRGRYDPRSRLGVLLEDNPGGSAKSIVIRENKAFIIGMDDRVWEGLPTGFQPLAGSPACRRLAVDQATGGLWVVTLDGHLMSFSSATGAWVEQNPGSWLDVCVHDGVPHALGADHRVYKRLGPIGWNTMAGRAEGHRIAVDAADATLWLVGTDNGILSYRGAGSWQPHPGAGPAASLSVRNGVVHAVGLDGSLWTNLAWSGTTFWHRMNVVEPV